MAHKRNGIVSRKTILYILGKCTKDHSSAGFDIAQRFCFMTHRYLCGNPMALFSLYEQRGACVNWVRSTADVGKSELSPDDNKWQNVGNLAANLFSCPYYMYYH